MRKFFRVLFTTTVLASDAVSGMAIADEGKVFGAMPKKTTKGRVASHVRSSLEELKTREGWLRRVEILRSVNRTVTDFTSQQGADLGSPELTFPTVYAMLLGVMLPKEGGEAKEGSVDSIAGYTQVLLTYCSIFSFDPISV